VDTGVAAADGGFEAFHVTEDGSEFRVSLGALAGVRLEDGRPVRSFPGVPRVRLPPASPGRCDDPAAVVFHFHSIA